jgi:hypothetical protein
MARIFICRARFASGSGATPREALRDARRNLPFTPDPGEPCFRVDMCDPSTTVGNAGGLDYPANAPPIHIGFYDVNGRVPIKVDIQ